MYSLSIKRYGVYINFNDNKEAFEAEVRRYFSPSQTAIANRMISFDHAENCGGYYRNKYQDMTTYYYPLEEA